MKVALYEGPRKITLKQRPDPKAGPGDVIIKIKYVGICGSDFHTYLNGGPVIPVGIVLGHENVGTVAEVGAGVKGWQVGDRVIASAPGPCGECYYCLHGRPSICVNGFPQTNGLARDGGMAEYMLVKDPAAMLHRIPDSVSFEDAVLFDIMCVGIKGVRESAFRFADNVVVVGAGAIGLSTIQMLKLAGARHVTALQPSAKKRELALQFGADLALNPAESGQNLQSKIRSLYDGIGADVAFECAGNPDSLQAAISSVRGGGQVLVLGTGGEPTPIIEGLMVLSEINMKFSLAYTADDINIFLDMLTKHRIKTEGMVSDIIKLDDIVEKGFERMANTKGLVKVLVAP